MIQLNKIHSMIDLPNSTKSQSNETRFNFEQVTSNFFNTQFTKIQHRVKFHSSKRLSLLYPR